jgi:hypothetical protein
VQKFQVQGAKKVQVCKVVSLRGSLSFLKQRSNWKIFSALSGLAESFPPVRSIGPIPVILMKAGIQAEAFGS